MKLMLIQRISKTLNTHSIKFIRRRALFCKEMLFPWIAYLGLVFLLPGILRLTNKAWNLLPTLDGQILI